MESIQNPQLPHPTYLPFPASAKPSHPDWATLPTMYDLPSEDPEEPGLPDDFHFFQPILLLLGFNPVGWDPQQVYCGSDINVYRRIGLLASPF